MNFNRATALFALSVAAMLPESQSFAAEESKVALIAEAKTTPADSQGRHGNTDRRPHRKVVASRRESPAQDAKEVSAEARAAQ